jgi:hypothetical protein
MADDPNGGAGDGGDGNDGSSNAGKTFTQDEVNRLIGERLGREREKFSDYDDLKAAAGRLKEIEEADQTEAQKAAKRAEEAEARSAAAETRLLRFEVAAAKGLDASGSSRPPRTSTAVPAAAPPPERWTT